MIRAFEKGQAFIVENENDDDEEFDDPVSIDIGKPVGVHYTSGSLTTFESVYPTFRVFEVDEETMLPVKIHTYKLDIHSENPQWELDHTLPDYFNLTDLRPSNIDEQLTNRILHDEDLAIFYENSRSNGGHETKIL